MKLEITVPEGTFLDEGTCRDAALVIIRHSADRAGALSLLAMCGLVRLPRTWRADDIGRIRRPA